jgi:ribosomal protein S18 acetylase RimI-like enzyme
MSTGAKQGLVRSLGLTQAELAEIEQLAALCNKHDKSDLKLNWGTLRSRPQDEINDFLYYEDDALVGYLALFSFNSREAESSGMVHPSHRRKGIFTTLFQATEEECRRRGIPLILFIIGHTYKAGLAFAKAFGMRYHHSEYKMVLKEPRLSVKFNGHLQFRLAKVEDAPVLAHITAVAFDLDETEVDWYSEQKLQDSARRYYVALLDDVYIGKIDVSLDEQEAFIYGFAVLPAFRGRGYGRQILAKTLQEILATGRRRASLEVATDNKNALSLYQSCGFKETGSYEYYSYDVRRT